MSPARRVIGILGASLGVLLALGVAFAAFVLFTTPGGRIALDVINGRELPVRAESFQGSLAGRFRLLGVTLSRDNIRARVDTLSVSWRPHALRAHRIQLNDVYAAGVRVTVREPSPDSASARPLNIADTTAARWSFGTERLRVRRASVTAPGGVNLHHIRVDASGGPDKYQAEMHASGDVWRFHNAGLFVRGTGDANGVELDSLVADVVGGRLYAGGTARWSPWPVWNVHLRADSLSVGELASAPEEWPGVVSFRARSSGELHEDSTHVDVNLASLDGTLRGRPLRAQGRASLRGHRLQVGDATVLWGSARVRFSGHMAEQADVTLDASIPSLGELLPRARGSLNVEGRVSGTSSRVGARVTARAHDVVVFGRDIPDLSAVIDASFDAEDYEPYAVDMRRADVQLAGGTLNVKGHASWKDALVWDATLHADDFETATLAPARWEISGPLSARVRTSGRHTGKELRGYCELASLSGTFRGRAVNGSGRVDVKNRDADISNLDLTWGKAHLAANGHYGKTVDISVDLAAPDISILRDDFRGAVVLKGTAEGSLPLPAVDVTFRADSLQVLDYAVEHAEGQIDFDPNFSRPADARILALGLSGGSASFDTVRVDLNGLQRDHTITLEARRGDLSGTLGVRGSLADSVWTGQVERMHVFQPLAGDWRAVAEAPLRASRSGATLGSLVLTSNGARLVAHGAWQRGDTTRVGVDLHRFPMATFQAFFPQATRITGTLQGGADVRVDPRGIVTAQAAFEAGPGRIVLAGKSLDYQGRVTASATEEGVAGALDMSVTHEAERVAMLDGDVRIQGYVIGRDSLGTQPLLGTLNVDCSNIMPLLAVMAPDVARSARGALTARLSTRGSVGDFRLAGNVDLTDAGFDLRSGLKLRDVGMHLVADGSGHLVVEGGATSGGGRVALSATSSRGSDARVSATFRVSGERFQVVNQPEARVFVSPAVEVRLNDRDLGISGDVRVPYARIELAEVPASAVAQSPDVVFAEDTLATRAPIHVHSSVRVALGDSVTFAGFGLRSRLEGSLVVKSESGQSARGIGEIKLTDGRYRAYGNDLTIDPGRLVFSGPIESPGLDIRAYRGFTTQNAMAGSSEIVGVRLTGTLRRPEFTTFSNPPMSESERLSFLMFGRPLSASSSGDQAALANAAMILGMAEGNEIAGDIGKHFALDEAYIETGDTFKEASFVAGKYLSPKLYVSYAAGFFEHTNTFRARYSLTDNWTLQVENGSYASSDLLYRFERGK